MRISNSGIELIKRWEGFRSDPYVCPAGVVTIGYGNTYYENGAKIRMSDPPISTSRAEALLRNTVKHYEAGVDSMTRDDITQAQFDALVSFAYNVGLEALRKSTLLKKVNANPNDILIYNQFLRWNKAGGRVLQGLTKRRKEEARMYFTHLRG
jgi:lysozyme